MKQLTKKQVVAIILCSLFITLFSPLVLSVNAPATSSIPTTSVFLNPSRISGTSGTTFTVNLNVTNVTDLYTFGAGIMFNHHTTSCTGMVQGSFMRTGGKSTLFLPGAIDNNLGIVGFSSETETGAATNSQSGSGTLMSWQFKMNGTGTSYSDLHILYLELLDYNNNNIPCQSIDYFTTSPGNIVKIVGNPQGGLGSNPYPGFNYQNYTTISQLINGTTYNRNMSFVIYAPDLSGTFGFFNVTIANALMAGQYYATLNGAVQTPLVTILNSTFTEVSLQFTYDSSTATEAVQILGTLGVIATAPPTYSGITKSTSYAGYSCTFGITWQDKAALSKYIFSFDNGVGSFTNDTAKAFTSNPQTISVTKTLTTKVGATVRYRWYANDTSNKWNSTTIQTFVTTASPPPTYSSITHSTTTAGTACVFSITCSDNAGLSKYIFSFDNGVGSFTNNTEVAFTSNPQTISATKTLNATVGATIRFRWFFNDTLNNWNSTAIQSFATTPVGHAVACTEVVSVDSAAMHRVPKTVFAKGFPIGINVTVADPGSSNENVTVTAYLNNATATKIASQNVTLLKGGTVLITLIGNTADLAYGNSTVNPYTVSANVSLAKGEVNTANGYIANSTIITVTIPGDIGGFGVVGTKDEGLLSKSWGMLVPPGDPRADINGDGKVGIMDLYLMGVNWGKTW